MVEGKKKLLIVEDDLDVAEMLDAYFRVQGYDVITVNWGEDAIESSHHRRPDLIILDIRLPDIDGFEVANRLRKARRTEAVPIIFLTEKRARSDILQGLSIGADDYITKPFDIQELRLRVRNSLKRASQGTIYNPVTGFPEGMVVEEKLRACINEKHWVIFLISIENLDFFRETYGFIASDDVIRAVGLMIRNAVRDLGNPEDFVGHQGSYQFLVVTDQAAMLPLEKRFNNRIVPSLEYFYPLKDRVDNLPQTEKLLNLRIKTLDSSYDSFSSLEQIDQKLKKQ